MDDIRFERLYAQHAHRVLSWCRFATPTAADAEDAAAETFARLLARGSHLPDSAVAAWLFTTSRRICIDMARRTMRERLVERVDEEVASADGPDTMWVDPELQMALRRLTTLQQQVVFLRVIEDLPFDTVARLTGRTTVAARVTCHRALRALARNMRGDDHGVASPASPDAT